MRCTSWRRDAGVRPVLVIDPLELARTPRYLRTPSFISGSASSQILCSCSRIEPEPGLPRLPLMHIK